jgi:hypothetical protein
MKKNIITVLVINDLTGEVMSTDFDYKKYHNAETILPITALFGKVAQATKKDAITYDKKLLRSTFSIRYLKDNRVFDHYENVTIPQLELYSE